MGDSQNNVQAKSLINRPKISVCLASYNGEQVIERQLKSILPQLGDNDEVIISDDYSTDQTSVVVSRCMDYRIKFIYNENRKGPVGNFQHALERSTGDIIFLSDQDDIWLPEKVNSTLILLQQYDLVLTDCKVVDANLCELYPSFFSARGSKSGLVRNLYKNSYMGCCMAFRRTILEYALPFPTHIYMHDWWIGLLVELKGKVYFNSTPMILYVRHGNNVSPTGEESYSFLRKFYNRFWLILALLSRLLF
ncbi:glycosyltransferase [Spirosoma sp. HMF3257]|uniref:Glycosyltransferase family 2 protein n=1 Tax=Spirosoma telluris TaxID=2183553 RepID=A0A327NH37_9BACT|nr:glycosyltransferase [Spirosoma telluris]RAI74701.1 glycosyltransferase family 2 protein [Spirosoma telluris]